MAILTRKASPKIPEFLAGGGEMGERIRTFDWSSTSLGPVEQWPRSLRTCVQIMLTSRQPIWIGWGKELIKLYNDPYKTIVMGKHPWALGKPASVVWKDIWKDIEPMLHKVMHENEGTYVEQQLLIMERNGYPEETYYTFSYTPVAGDHGGTEGMICFNSDDTDWIISERQLRTLTQLGKSLADARSNEDVFRRTADTLETNPNDFPFALIYQLSGTHATLVNPAALDDSARLPRHFDLASEHELARLARKAVSLRKPQQLDELQKTAGAMPAGAWNIPPGKAVVLPVAQRGQKEAYGFMVVGLNPFRLLDDKYLSFFELVADQVATSLADINVLEEERQRLEALAEIDRAKTTFFSNISHEFRTPLTLLLGPIEDLLNDSRLDPGGKEKAEVAFRNALRMQKLVNLLLDFSRIEAGRMEANFTLVDIGALTEDLAANFRSAIERAGMQLIIKREAIQQSVYVDTDMWEKIVLNLLSNAFKYSEKGEIEVSVRTAGDHVQVAVRDTGVGIPQQEIERIFERFHRVQNVRGRSQEGTGIGLAMVRELVRLLHGTITVQSEVGMGSIFTISLPLGKDLLQDKELYAPRPVNGHRTRSSVYVEEALQWTSGHANGNPSAKDTRTGTVLLADDNADMRKYMQRLLENEYRVIVVNDGEEAFAQAVQHLPDLIISDIMMPKLDGFSLLKKLKTNLSTRNIPLIFLSARAGDEAKVEGLEAGADDYLTKPFSSRELLARVSNHIAISTARRKTEKEFFNLFLQAPAHIHVFRGPEHMVEFFHPLGMAFTGRDLTGMKLREAMPGLEGQGLFEVLDNVYTQGITVHSGETKAILPNQEGVPTDYYFNNTYLPWRNLKGEIQGVLQFTFEVTETAQQRLKAEANERKFRSIAQQAPVAMSLMIGPSHVVEIANDRLLEMWGRTYEQVIHQPILGIFPELKAQGFGEILDRVFSTGEPFIANELPVTVNRGNEPKTIFINLFYEPFRNENNEIEGIVAVGSDVTEQVRARRQIEEAENKLKIALEMADLGTWQLNLKDRFIEYSANVASWWGLPERGACLPEMVGCIHPDDQEEVSAAVERAIRERTFYEVEYRVRHAQTSQERYIHASGQIVYDDNREPLQLSGIARDVTLQKMTEQELEKLVTLRTRELQEVNAELVRSNENLRQFAYVASHDLQEPLRKIITYTDLILARSKEALSDTSREYLSKIAVGSQRMSSLIKDLLEFSQAERKDELYTNVDLNQVLHDVRNDYDVIMAEKGAMLEAGALCVVEAIPLQMNQLFYNLVGNALKFARPDQPPRVKISSRMIGDDEKKDMKLDAGKAYCEITFEDNGIGFEPKFAEQIFVLFQRLHVRDRYEGTGIGLALCKKIVENHKGIIHAEGHEGKGAVFKVVLPLKVREVRRK